MDDASTRDKGPVSFIAFAALAIAGRGRGLSRETRRPRVLCMNMLGQALL